MNIELIDFQATDGVLTNGFIVKNNSNKILIATHGMSSNCFKTRERVIAQKVSEIGIDFLGFNNRGSELVKYVKKYINNKEINELGGTTYENPLDGYYDIKGAIQKAVELGYTDIYLQGHSLGSTKVVYTYNKLKSENSELLKYIKGVILLSLIDIPKVLKIYLNKNFEEILKFANEKEKNNFGLELMPNGTFIHPISVKTFLRYAQNNGDINFAQYSVENFEFDKLNNINVPIFMRWGNVYEMIEQPAQELAKYLNSKIYNDNKNIDYIDGANHGYTGKEEFLASQIVEFLKDI